MTSPAPLVHPPYDYSGKAFGAPSPVLLTKAWRVKKGIRSSAVLTHLAVGATSVLSGQDSIFPASCTKGQSVYGGYFNGTFADLTAFRADFPSAPYILSITPNGAKGARCVDCEPGDVTVAEAANFVSSNLPSTPSPGQGRNDQGKPMVYCSAGDSQAVINAISAKGISRSDWVLWSAHWIGNHICSPGGCGYPQADATQYMSGPSFDSDLFYSYCFGAVSPWPLTEGSTGSLVATMQANINKWADALGSKFGVTNPLTVDGDFGLVTLAAVAVAQVYFKNGAPSGECDEELYNDLAAGPVPVDPPPWAYSPVTGLKLLGAGPHSVKFQFSSGAQAHSGLAKFQVVVCKGDKLTTDISGFPRYITFEATGTYTQQYGDVEPSTGYIMGVRAMAQDGSHSSSWAILHFQTAPA